MPETGTIDRGTSGKLSYYNFSQACEKKILLPDAYLIRINFLIYYRNFSIECRILFGIIYGKLS